MKLLDGLFHGKDGWSFHIAFKEGLRNIMKGDPDFLGTLLDQFDELYFNERLAVCEPGDNGICINEEFLNVMIRNYETNIKRYNPTIKEEKRAIKSSKVVMALYRNDSAYYERIGGTIDHLMNDNLVKIYLDPSKISNYKKISVYNIEGIKLLHYYDLDSTKDKMIIWVRLDKKYENDFELIVEYKKRFNKINIKSDSVINLVELFSTINSNLDKDYSEIISKHIYEWWKVNDKRVRTAWMIEWIFKYILRKYKFDLFHRRSVNMLLSFMMLNSAHWKSDETFKVENWYPRKRGNLVNAYMKNF